MIKRAYTQIFNEKLENFPILAILGPRQCGKTTFVQLVAKKYSYFDLEKPSHLTPFQTDPENRLEHLGTQIILDEAQRLPELFPILRGLVDESRNLKGQYILLGSASPTLIKNISESLAGRVTFIEMSPFSLLEVFKKEKDFNDLWVYGGFPDVWLMKSENLKWEWREGYVQTFIERDLNALGITVDSNRMRILWGMLAHVNGGLWNASQIASSMAVSQTTVNRYIDILEQTYLIKRLMPYFKNIGKRYVKSPKVYFRDTGLLHYFLNIKNINQLDVSPYKGGSFETFVIQQVDQLLKIKYPGSNMYYWRSSGGAEVDLILEVNGKTIPIEIKLTTSPTKSQTSGLKSFMHDMQLERGYVLFPGTESYSLTEGIYTLPLVDLVQHPEEYF